MSKINLGSGKKLRKGWINIDGLPYDGIDYEWDLVHIPYPFLDKIQPIEEIEAIEVLEHISWRDSLKVVKEWYNILETGGRLTIQVPDCGKMMEMYVNKEICDCVPHKASSWEGFKPDSDCYNCKGKAKVNPTRWLFSFTGAQKHGYDTHKNTFTKESLKSLLIQAGFMNIKFTDNIYKLIVVCKK